jgi:hypothetical protein
MANLDFLKSFNTTTYIFGSYAFNPEVMKPFTPVYQELYPSMNLIDSLGTSFYFIVFSFVARLFLLYLQLIQKRLKRGEYWALDWLIKMWKKLFS